MLLIAGNYLLVKELSPYFIGYIWSKLTVKEPTPELDFDSYPVKYVSMMAFTLGMLVTSILINTFDMKM